jgi:hypothetical protein
MDSDTVFKCVLTFWCKSAFASFDLVGKIPGHVVTVESNDRSSL